MRPLAGFMDQVWRAVAATAVISYLIYYWSIPHSGFSAYRDFAFPVIAIIVGMVSLFTFVALFARGSQRLGVGLSPEGV